MELRSIIFDNEVQFDLEYESFFSNDEYQLSRITERANDPIIYFMAYSSYETVLVSLIKEQ